MKHHLFEFAITDRERETLDALFNEGSNRKAAAAIGVTNSTITSTLERIRRRIDAAAPTRVPKEELTVPKAPDPNEPIADIIARKKQHYSRLQAKDEFNKLIPIGVRIAGPVAICAVGDPHVDDDLCDIGRIEDDMTIIGKSKGMYALHVGDITNNWVGRLGRLYAHQNTSAADGIRLAEWMFGLAPPLAVVGGNHDLWNEGMSWLSFAVKQAGCDTLQSHGVRMSLNFPGGKSVRIHCRHDFPGHSQFNPVHGLRKEHLHGLRDHVNIAGHKHIDTYAVVPSPDGYMQHMLRVSGYKGHDDYAKQGNYQPMKMAPTCALVIDPDTRNQAELIKPFWDMREAADYLSFKRARM